MTRAIVLAAVAVCAIAWSQESRGAESAQPPWLTFSRTDCFGVCPVFTLRVFADGRVEYEGKRFVIQRGRRRTNLGSDRLRKLRNAVVEAKFAELDPKCCACRGRTDAASTIIEIADAAGTKSINHYHGCAAAPPSIEELEDAVISITRAETWVGSDAERARQKWNRGSR